METLTKTKTKLTTNLALGVSAVALVGSAVIVGYGVYSMGGLASLLGISTTATPSSGISTAITPSLVGHWNFDDANISLDLSGLSNNAEIVGSVSCSFEYGLIKSGCVFGQAANNYLKINSVANDMSPAQGTISVWAYPTATGNNRYVIEGMGSNSDRYYIQWTGGQFRVVRGNPAASLTLLTNVELNKWYHLVLSWDRDTLYGYINGELKGSKNFTTTGKTPTRFNIGYQAPSLPTYPDKTFPGYIDEVTFYNQKLSDEDINDIYDDGFYASLVGYWNFNHDSEAESNVVLDSSQLGNNGEVVGSVPYSSEYGFYDLGRIFGQQGNYININSVADDMNLNQGTISVWAYPTETGTNRYVIEGMGSNSDRYYIQWTGGQFRVVRGNPAAILTLNTDIQFNRWYHLVLSWEGNTMYGYVNGELKGSKTFTSTGKTPTRFNIGNQVAADNRTFPGYIDEVNFYSRRLSDSQVKKIYDFYWNLMGCSDSDGLDLYTKGTTTGIRQGHIETHTDYCHNSSYVLEGVCIDNKLETRLDLCEFGCNDGACIQASIGALSIGRDGLEPAGNIAVGIDQFLGSFEFEVKKEPITISLLNIWVKNNPRGLLLENLMLIDAQGQVVAGPMDPIGVPGAAFTDIFTVPVGINTYKLVGTLSSANGWVAGDTVSVAINNASEEFIQAVGENSGEDIPVSPAGQMIDGPVMTVKDAELIVTKNSTAVDKTVFFNSTKNLVGSWIFDAANSAEDIRITSIAVACSSTAINLTLYDGDTALIPSNDTPTIDGDGRGTNMSGTSTFVLSEPILIPKGTSKVIDLKVDIPSNTASGHTEKYGITSNTAVSAYSAVSGNTVVPKVIAHDGAVITIIPNGHLTINEDASSASKRLVIAGTSGENVIDLRFKAIYEDIDIRKLRVYISDGGLYGTDVGGYDDVSKFYLKLDGQVVGNAAGYSVAGASTEVNFEAGQVVIPQGSTGKKLSILVDLAEIGTGLPGTDNADIKVGLSGPNGLQATGVSSNNPAREFFIDASGSSVIIHKAVPQVVIENPGTTLGANSLLHHTKITAVGGPIGIWRLAYQATTSTKVNLINAYTVLSSCQGGCGSITNGSQLSDITSGYYIPFTINKKIFDMPISSSQPHGKYYLEISENSTAVIDLYATVNLTANNDYVVTSLLSDIYSWNNGTSGKPASTSIWQIVNGGSFVWSPLNDDNSQTASSLTAEQWYNGYLVSGLGVATTTPITIGE